MYCSLLKHYIRLAWRRPNLDQEELFCKILEGKKERDWHADLDVVEVDGNQIFHECA